MSCTSCILPYIHLYAEPNGEVKPCCIAGGFEEKLSLRDNNVDEVFNSKQMKELRESMEKGERHSACNICYEREDRGEKSPRERFNENTLWKMPEVKEDFSVDTDLQHVDIRFSNLCNFKCRMCNHTFSSNWYDDAAEVEGVDKKPEKKVITVSDTIVEDLKPYIKNVKSWYFAGGEPLIMPQHAELLNYLHTNLPTKQIYGLEKKNLSIHYNTNLSILQFEKYNFLDIWFDFLKVFLSISCDGVEKVGEYQRTGFKHDVFVKNLKKIREYFNPGSTYVSSIGYNYNFQYTTTIYNVYHMWDFYQYMMDNNFIEDESNIDFYFAWAPNRSALKFLPRGEKGKVLKYLESIQTKFSESETQNRIQSIIDFTKEEPDEQFYKYQAYGESYLQNKKIDELRGTSLKELNGIDLDAGFNPKVGSKEWLQMQKKLI